MSPTPINPKRSAAQRLTDLPLKAPLPLPPSVAEPELFNWLSKVRVEGAPAEIANYCRQDFHRFVYTYGLVRGACASGGIVLELGANPYFTTYLLRQFLDNKLVLANYFGPQMRHGIQTQSVDYEDWIGGTMRRVALEYHHFNVETDKFPFPDESFDVVVFCEIIEHLQNDPLHTLREIRRVLAPGGSLVLSTPNVSRLENVAKMLAGVNIYDPYSGYGPYGRHNREYNKHELAMLLGYVGFEIHEMFSANVHRNAVADYFEYARFADLVRFREHDLGQYLFVRAVPSWAPRLKKPAWLYRSYPDSELE